MSEPPPPDPSQKFIGWMLIAIGGLIALLSGTCTLVVIGGTLFSMVRFPADPGMMLTGLVSGGLVVALFGGIPFAAGVLLLRVGWRMWRPRPKITPDRIAVFGEEPPP